MRRHRIKPGVYLADAQIRHVYAAANRLPPDKQYRFVLLISCRLRLAGRTGPISNPDLQSTIEQALTEVTV